MMTGKNWNCGIYCIRNTVTGECYVGQSKQVFGRWYSHFERLANGKHVCPKFQKSFDAFSAAAFKSPKMALFAKKCDAPRLSNRGQRPGKSFSLSEWTIKQRGVF
jgi:hypothetical protein